MALCSLQSVPLASRPGLRPTYLPTSSNTQHSIWRRPTTRKCTQTAAQRPRTPVVELLVLLEARQGTSEEDQQGMVEQLWSQQYCFPGVIAASGGTLSYPTPVTPLSQVTQPKPPHPQQTEPSLSHSSPADGFTHMVHFRFSSVAHAQAFLKQPSVKSMLTVAPPPTAGTLAPDDTVESATEPICVRTSVLAFQGSVPSDMEAVFRRGPDFERGADLMFVLRSTEHCVATAAALAARPVAAGQEADSQGTASSRTSHQQEGLPGQAAAQAGGIDGAGSGDAGAGGAAHAAAIQEFTSELALLAQSSVAGAVQVSYGPALVLFPKHSSEATSGMQGSRQQQSTASDTSGVPDQGQGLQDLSTLLQGVGPAAAGNQAAGARNADLLRGACHVFMARFPSREQLSAFRATAPCVALWEQRGQVEREPPGRVPPLLPLCAETELVMLVHSAQGAA